MRLSRLPTTTTTSPPPHSPHRFLKKLLLLLLTLVSLVSLLLWSHRAAASTGTSPSHHSPNWLTDAVRLRTFQMTLDSLISSAPEYISLKEIERMQELLESFVISQERTLYVDDWVLVPDSRCPLCRVVTSKPFRGSYGARVTHTEERYRADVNLSMRCFELFDYDDFINPPNSNYFQVCMCEEASEVPEYAKYYKDERKYCDLELSMFNRNFPFSMANFYRRSSPSFLAKRILKSPPPKNPNRKLLFLHHNCRSTSKREDVIKQLMNYFPVHALSDCLQNNHTFTGDSIVWKEELKDKEALASTFSFVAALENHVQEHYLTEKRWDVWVSGSIPLVFGGKSESSSLRLTPSPSAIIYVDDYDGDYEALAHDLLELSESKEKYLKRFDWQRRGIHKLAVRELFNSDDYTQCRLCEHIDYLHESGLFQPSKLFVDD